MVLRDRVDLLGSRGIGIKLPNLLGESLATAASSGATTDSKGDCYDVRGTF